MTTYADIHDRVEKILVEPAEAVRSEIPRLVFDAHRRLEQDHSWLACEAEWPLFVAPGENTTRTPVVTRAFLRLLDRKERPYLVGRAVTVLTDAGSVSANYYIVVGPTVAPAGAQVVLVSSEVAALVPLATRALEVSGATALPGVITYTLYDPTLSIPLTGLTTGETLTLLGDADGKRYPLEWIAQLDVRRWFSGSVAEQRPTHLTSFGVGEDGTPSFAIYPTPDTAYEIRVPCLLSLLASTTTPPAETEDNWLTNFGFEALSHMAAAEAFELGWDDERATRHRSLAEMAIRKLKALDARLRVNVDTFQLSSGSRGPSTPRSPRW